MGNNHTSTMYAFDEIKEKQAALNQKAANELAEFLVTRAQENKLSKNTKADVEKLTEGMTSDQKAEIYLLALLTAVKSSEGRPKKKNSSVVDDYDMDSIFGRRR